MSKYVVGYYVEWRNGSHETRYLINDGRQMFTSSLAGFWFHWFYNCYAMKVPPDKQIQTFSVRVKNNKFPSGNRPNSYDMMALLHYPNQLLRSLKTVKYAWSKRKTNDTYSMKFKINGVEIIRRRNKSSRPCDKNWDNYDDNVIVDYTNAVGYRAPSQNPSNKIAQCSSKDKMKEARFRLRTNESGILPPCKTMEKIYYTYEESELSGGEWSGTCHFWVGSIFLIKSLRKLYRRGNALMRKSCF